MAGIAEQSDASCVHCSIGPRTISAHLAEMSMLSMTVWTSVATAEVAGELAFAALWVPGFHLPVFAVRPSMLMTFMSSPRRTG